MLKDKRQKRDLHALNADGMVLCNPRDKEAAHRSEMEGIATADRAAVTCRKCQSLRRPKIFYMEDSPMIADLERLNQTWNRAWIDKDAARIEKMMADEYVYVAPN